MSAHGWRTLRRAVVLCIAFGATGALLYYAPVLLPSGFWEPTIRKFEAEDRVSPPPQHAIVFIGSSSIRLWNLPEYFPELGRAAINRGFGGSLLSDSVQYADRIVIPYKPRIIVLYAGDNDIDTGASARQVADRFTQFDRKVHAALPQTRIIFISIKPSLLRWSHIDTIRLANSEIRDYCATHSNLAFLDIDPQMLGTDGKPKADLLAADGVHMMPGGYRIWTYALKPLLR